jgi:hypothetical protein
MAIRIYRGHCHCGQYRYKIESPEIASTQSCSCEVCRKTGYLVATVPIERFEVTQSHQQLSTYSSGNARHQFCRNCGTPLLIDHGDAQSKSTLSINVSHEEVCCLCSSTYSPEGSLTYRSESVYS